MPCNKINCVFAITNDLTGNGEEMLLCTIYDKGPADCPDDCDGDVEWGNSLDQGTYDAFCDDDIIDLVDEVTD